jgi:isorenieratene synthase
MTARELKLFGRKLPPMEAESSLPDWKQADPAWIEKALAHALARPGGGWVAVDAARRITDRPRRYRIAGRDWVAWRDRGRAHLAPDACPHMGASLEGACNERGKLVCPWHGLRLGPEGHADWQLTPTHDDGLLLWARLLDEETPTETPILPPRPPRFLDAVLRHEASCDTQDILANRLDPWHGAHYHPYSFGRLQVIEQLEDEITVRVVYRVAGPYGVEVDARFHCPDPRSIVMTILRGEGEGSVVETHATPIQPGRSAVVELTLASSDHPRFWSLAEPLAPLLRPLVRRAAQRLWVDDAAYAERRHRLRTTR